MTQTAERTLETLVGALVKIFLQFKRDTIQHSDQLTNERRTAEEPLRTELRNQQFYTADSYLYTVEKEGEQEEVFFYLGREPTNPIFNNIGEATQQLIKTGNYIPPKEDVEAVKSADTTLRVNLSDLNLQRLDDEVSYFEIDTVKYDSLNQEQRRVAERLYGQGNDFKENMKMFNNGEIKKTRVYFLNPDYVKEHVPQDGALARASCLDGFLYRFRFYANDRNVDYCSGLLGVRNVVAEGGAPKVEDPIADAYKTILGADPDQALRAMTLEIAIGLARLMVKCLGNQQKP